MDQCRLLAVAEPAQDDTDRRWRIDDLAQRTGLTVRNIRAYQSRGLLPGPDVHGRTGFYGPEHAERITLIRELQGEGFNLEAIRRLIDAAPDAGDEPLRFLQAVTATFGPEQPEVTTWAQAARQWGEDGPRVLERAIALGLARPVDDRHIEYPSPRLIRAAFQMMAMGMPIDRLLDITEQMREHADGIAALYVEVFLKQVWKPFRDAGSPPERWADVRETLDRLGGLGAEVLQAVFAAAMSAAIEGTLARELSAHGGDDGAAPRRAPSA